MQRTLLSSYLCVTGGLLIGLYLAWSVVSTEPAIIGWALCVGGGMATGAWIAAMASGTPLAGGPSGPRRHIPLDDMDLDDRDTRSRRAPGATRPERDDR